MGPVFFELACAASGSSGVGDVTGGAGGTAALAAPGRADGADPKIGALGMAVDPVSRNDAAKSLSNSASIKFTCVTPSPPAAPRLKRIQERGHRCRERCVNSDSFEAHRNKKRYNLQSA